LKGIFLEFLEIYRHFLGDFFKIIKTPIILTNGKTYGSVTGENAVKMAILHQEVSKETGHTFAIAVQSVDIYRTCQSVDIPVFAQHCDLVDFGSNTGWLLPEAIKEAGAVGTLLHHSEHRFSNFEKLKGTIHRVRSVGLLVCVCAETAEEGKEIERECSPDFIAVEPPELIGGNISVSTARPELISDTVRQVSPGNVLVGAGIKNGDDVAIAVELGAKGVLLASGVTKAQDPKKVLLDLVSKI
jgi:triosephosphate isomerase